MKAILDQDIIITWSTGQNGVEVGDPPDGVRDLSRLRFDGTALIDLTGLSQMHVTTHLGCWTLHCIAVPGSQLVTMTYGQKKQLINDDGVYRLKTTSEIAEAAIDNFNTLLKSNLRQALTSTLGDTEDQIADLNKAIVLIMTVIADGPGAAAARTVIEALAPLYTDIYPADVVQPTLTINAAILKNKMPKYYEDRQ